MFDDSVIRRVLNTTARIALVGASNNPARPSFDVMAYLLQHGYQVDPVNPALAGETLHGRRVYGALDELPEVPDMVDCFRRSESIMPIAEAAVAVGATTLWLQLGVSHPGAEDYARAAGMTVIVDRCPKIEIPRLGIQIRPA